MGGLLCGAGSHRLSEGQIDYAKLMTYVPKIQFLGARASISFGYQDVTFVRNKSECLARGIPFMGYHVIYPKQTAISQMDNFYRVAGNARKVLDFELAGDGGADTSPAPPSQQATILDACSNICLMRDGIRPIIYSRRLLMNVWLVGWTVAMLNQHYYWLAQYLDDTAVEDPGPLTLPNRILRGSVIIHQTSDHKSNVGMGVPVKKATDTDRWVGVMSIAQFFGAIPPPPVEPTDAQKVAKLWSAHPEIH
jgi:hypothetical protein